MSPTPSPDWDGFKAAQRRLRQHFGQSLTFYFPVTASYPAGTQLNPDNGKPYDPTIEPESGGGFTTRIVSVNVVSDQIGARNNDDVVKQAIGWVEQGKIVLIVDIEDWHLVRDATECEYANERYIIRQDEYDRLGDADRYLLFCEQA